MKSKNAQIWVETVLYTLIALTIIGIALGLAKPKILEFKDRIAVERGINMLTELHSIITDASGSVGNVRIFVMGLKKGSLTINASGDTITYVLENSNVEFSEPGLEIRYGDITVKTEKKAGLYDISLRLNYTNSGIDLLYKRNNSATKQFSAAPIPYKLRIESINETAETIQIDISLIS